MGFTVSVPGDSHDGCPVDMYLNALPSWLCMCRELWGRHSGNCYTDKEVLFSGFENILAGFCRGCTDLQYYQLCMGILCHRTPANIHFSFLDDSYSELR